jgi:hypothetical protein
MPQKLKLTLAGFFAAALMSCLARPTLASTGIGTPGTTVTMTGKTTITYSGVNVICTFTYSFTPAARISKVAGTAVGSLSPVTVNQCNPATISGSGSNATSLSYSSFSGTLPGITGLNGANTTARTFILRGAPFPGSGCTFTVNSGGAIFSFYGSPSSFTSSYFIGSATSSTVGCPTTISFRAGPLTLSSPIVLTLI